MTKPPQKKEPAEYRLGKKIYDDWLNGTQASVLAKENGTSLAWIHFSINSYLKATFIPDKIIELKKQQRQNLVQVRTHGTGGCLGS